MRAMRDGTGMNRTALQGRTARWHRRASAGRTATLVAILAVLAGGAFASLPDEASAQDAGAWEIRTDPFADLWFHGLATVGFHGFGAVPMYAPELVDPSGGRAALLTAFHSDPAYEVLHFVPLFMVDAPVGPALDALGDLETHRHQGEPAIETGAHRVEEAPPAGNGSRLPGAQPV